MGSRINFCISLDDSICNSNESTVRFKNVWLLADLKTVSDKIEIRLIQNISPGKSVEKIFAVPEAIALRYPDIIKRVEAKI